VYVHACGFVTCRLAFVIDVVNTTRRDRYVCYRVKRTYITEVLERTRKHCFYKKFT